ncbi:hypothetical protein KIW84_061145 [Lathyrus oleraceus]|uniref:Uncharacterized protein n=1 Tax=Pisum sativum TaxID=3888 RepID=A0A9D4W4M0_PEA|nr:hypothetical protein KIW84_061145 [Pisum sativum]
MAKGNTTPTQFPVNLHDFKGENYESWLAQMKVIFRFQVVVEIVNDRVPILETGANDVRNAAHMEQRKKDGKKGGVTNIEKAIHNDLNEGRQINLIILLTYGVAGEPDEGVW